MGMSENLTANHTKETVALLKQTNAKLDLLLAELQKLTGALAALAAQTAPR